MAWCCFKATFYVKISQTLLDGLRCSLHVRKDSKTFNFFRRSCYGKLKWPFKFALLDYKPFRVVPIRQQHRSHLLQTESHWWWNVITRLVNWDLTTSFLCAIRWSDDVPHRSLGNWHVQKSTDSEDGMCLPQEYRALTLLDKNETSNIFVFFYRQLCNLK